MLQFLDYPDEEDPDFDLNSDNDDDDFYSESDEEIDNGNFCLFLLFCLLYIIAFTFCDICRRKYLRK